MLRWTWRCLSRADKAYSAADNSYRIEPDWRWSDRLGKRIPDGWLAYQGSGPTRKVIGSFDRLDEAKTACEKREQ